MAKKPSSAQEAATAIAAQGLAARVEKQLRADRSQKDTTNASAIKLALADREATQKSSQRRAAYRALHKANGGGDPPTNLTQAELADDTSREFSVFERISLQKLVALLPSLEALASGSKLPDQISKQQKNIAQQSKSLEEIQEKIAAAQSELLKLQEKQGKAEKLILNAFTQSKSDIDQQAKGFEASINAAVAAFSQSNAVAEPVKLWEAKESEHQSAKNWAFGMFCVGMLLIVGLVAALAYTMYHYPSQIDDFLKSPYCNVSKPETCTGLNIRSAIAFGGLLTLLTMLLWFARLQMKLFLAERQMQQDARERRAFAQTYVGLLRQNDTTKEAQDARAVVYAALFRPASDGTVRDEGGFDPAISAAISKLLTK